MHKKLLSLFLCLITVLFVNNPAFAIEKNHTIIDNYKPELSSFINVSEGTEPIYLARERTRSSGSNEMSWLWIGSLFMTGLGQILLGEVWRGLGFMALVIGGIIVIGFTMGYFGPSIGTLYALIIQIWSTVDAYNIAWRKAYGDDEEARLIQEQLAKLEESLNKFSVSNNQLKYSLASF